MHINRPSLVQDCSLAASAQDLQRAAGGIQKHAASADAVPTLGTTLAHIEEALDRLSVGMLQMATGVAVRCGEPEPGPDEDRLPAEAHALCFHLRVVAHKLHAAQDACTSSRIWAHRLLDSRSGDEDG